MQRADFPYGVLAAADLGSNSFRLQISRIADRQLFTLDSMKETVRLGGGLGPDKVLDDAACGRALACLARFGERLRGFEPGQVRVVGTNALRIARNAPEFMREAQTLLGFPIEIIAGREEARLIYLGAAHALPNTHESRLVVDIGGGSTEFIVGSQFSAHLTESLPLGCVSYTMRYFADGKITRHAMHIATLAARNEIQRITHIYTKDQWQLAVGTSGSARSLRDMLALNDGSSGKITRAGLLRLRDAFVEAGHIERLLMSGLKPDRAQVMPGGLAIMLAIFEELDIDVMSVGEGALRDGVLYDLMGRQRDHDQRELTVTAFAQRYHVDEPQAARVRVLAERFYRQLSGEDRNVDTLRQLLWAARLHEIGVSIAHIAYHKHTAYILQNADMPGFSRQEQNNLATLVLGQRGDMGKMKVLLLSVDRCYAILALRLAVLFCRSRTALLTPENMDLKPLARGFCLSLDGAWLDACPLTISAFEQDVEQWRKIGFQLNLVRL
ncbi:Ppx/GppA phosphatase family protein [Craterilacuibacter sp.]|uniref:Ppx/GppA phosphatase family protein n=1 Tax=Craterilacuibacter sp. TaxID=2870909 RepID=UPI003F3F50F7